MTRAMMTLYYVPRFSGRFELTDDFNERTEVVAFRYFFSYVGGILTYGIGFLYYFLRRSSMQTPMGPFGITLSLLMMASVLWTVLGTRSRIPHLPSSRVSHDKISPWSVLKKTLSEIRSALTNQSFRWLFSGVLIVFAMVVWTMR